MSYCKAAFILISFISHKIIKERTIHLTLKKSHILFITIQSFCFIFFWFILIRIGYLSKVFQPSRTNDLPIFCRNTYFSVQRIMISGCSNPNINSVIILNVFFEFHLQNSNIVVHIL